MTDFPKKNGILWRAILSAKFLLTCFLFLGYHRQTLSFFEIEAEPRDPYFPNTRSSRGSVFRRRAAKAAGGWGHLKQPNKRRPAEGADGCKTPAGSGCGLCRETYPQAPGKRPRGWGPRLPQKLETCPLGRIRTEESGGLSSLHQPLFPGDAKSNAARERE